MIGNPKKIDAPGGVDGYVRLHTLNAQF